LGPAIEHLTAAPGGGSTLKAALVLLRRLRRLHADLWGFLDDFGVPPTNNGSEQALRTWKVKQRRSGTFRSEDAARQWLLIGSYLDTCRKHGHTPEQALDAALAGRPFVPAAPALVAA